MASLSIVERELRVASRANSTYRLRVSAAVVTFVILGWNLLTFSRFGMNPAALGRNIFGTLITLAYFFALSSGPRLAADCISSEKRDGTLGLLFLTDLGGVDIILGKLASVGLRTAYSLLSITPIFMIPVLFGGVTGMEVVRMVLGMLVLALFSLSTGIFCSTFFVRQKVCVWVTSAILLAATMGGPFASDLLAGGGVPIQKGLTACSVGASLYFGRDLEYRSSWAYYWISIATGVGLSFIALTQAIRHCPKRWQDSPDSAAGAKRKSRFKIWVEGDKALRNAYRANLLDQNAFLWRVMRNRIKPLWVWAVVAVAGAFILERCLNLEEANVAASVTLTILACLSFVIKYWVGSEAAATLAEDHRNGTLELLLSTGLSVDEVLEGQSLALRRIFLKPVAVIFAAAAVTICLVMAELSSNDRFFSWMMLISLGFLVFDVCAIPWVSMEGALRNKKGGRATNTGFTRIVLGPIALAFLSSPLLFFAGSSSNDILPLMWMLVCAGFNIHALVVVRERLRTNFREWASARFQPAKPSFWQRLFQKEEPVPPVISA
jgi:ABC-type Na+ efflux pump permease subunit